MNIRPDNITQHEIIGLPVHIVESTDPSLVCKEGIVVGESREMIDVQTNNRVSSFTKKNSVFDLTLPDNTVVRVSGQLLHGRPEDRMKKIRRRSW